jgi:hypothetical protein
MFLKEDTCFLRNMNVPKGRYLLPKPKATPHKKINRAREDGGNTSGS